MKTPIAIQFSDVPEATISEEHQQNFSAIINDANVVLVRGKFRDKWRTFIASIYDEKGVPVDVENASLAMRGFDKLQIFPVAMIFEGTDYGECLSATGEKIVFDKTQITQKFS